VKEITNMDDYTFSFWNWMGLAIILTPFVFGFTLIGLQKRILIQHPSSGIIKNGYIGWSWTYLIFGWFVPVYRGEISIGIFHLVLTFFTFGFFQLIMSFLYNKQFMTRMLTQGWILADSYENNTLAMQKLNINPSF
jgi:uncharacterized membrane protein YcaP (DUF421 family)